MFCLISSQDDPAEEGEALAQVQPAGALGVQEEVAQVVNPYMKILPAPGLYAKDPGAFNNKSTFCLLQRMA